MAGAGTVVDRAGWLDAVVFGGAFNALMEAAGDDAVLVGAPFNEAPLDGAPLADALLDDAPCGTEAPCGAAVADAFDAWFAEAAA